MTGTVSMTVHDRKLAVEALTMAARIIRREIEFAGPVCEHDVNLCVCELQATLGAITTALYTLTGTHDPAGCASVNTFGARCDDCAPDVKGRS